MDQSSPASICVAARHGGKQSPSPREAYSMPETRSNHWGRGGGHTRPANKRPRPGVSAPVHRPNISGSGSISTAPLHPNAFSQPRTTTTVSHRGIRRPITCPRAQRAPTNQRPLPPTEALAHLATAARVFPSASSFPRFAGGASVPPPETPAAPPPPPVPPTPAGNLTPLPKPPPGVSSSSSRLPAATRSLQRMMNDSSRSAAASRRLRANRTLRSRHHDQSGPGPPARTSSSDWSAEGRWSTFPLSTAAATTEAPYLRHRPGEARRATPGKSGRFLGWKPRPRPSEQGSHTALLGLPLLRRPPVGTRRPH